jgi:mono/diheme cytochrome c family protein
MWVHGSFKGRGLYFKKYFFEFAKIPIFIFQHLYFMKKLLLIAGLALLQLTGYAQTPNWSTGVAPILYNHCAPCHHDGGIAPFSLLTYDDAVANSGAMKADVLSKKMPPWSPDPTYSHMAHERVLSPVQIDSIVAWVNGGTPKGNPALAPPTPTYSNTGQIPGTPDLVVKIPVYTSTAATGDVYQCFVVPSGLTADKYISAFEAVPGNPAIVHHVLVYSDTTGACAALQTASTTKPGYPYFGGVDPAGAATMIGGWVPGTEPMSYPTGFGVRIPKHADIVIQVHYPAGTALQKDSTEIHFFFTTAPVVRNVYIEPVLYHGYNIDRPLSIAANTTTSFYEKQPMPFDLTLISVAPHMHLIGQNINSFVVHPAGDTDQIIRINKWDFHWQGFYLLPKLKKIPAGTTLWANAYYDNTSANPNNPSGPPKDVVAGEQTTNEMMIVFYVYAYYQPGDENIVVDPSIYLNTPQQYTNYYKGQLLLDVCPNPTANDMIVKCFLDDADVGSLSLVDMSGRVVRQLLSNAKMNTGYTAYTYSIGDLPSGNYLLEMRTSQNVITKKIVVAH